MTRDLRITFLGDSFVQGLGDPEYRGWPGRALQQAGVTATAFNLGIRRNTSADVRRRWAAELTARLLPGADNRLVVSVGSNDAMLEDGAPRVGHAGTLTNLAAVLDGAHALGLTALVVGPPPVVCGGPEHLDRLLRLVPDQRGLCERRGVPFLDVTRALAEDPVWVAEATAGDGAHPGAGGYRRLAGLVLAAGFAGWLTNDLPRS
ncbi:GDSL-type esterase/lipase family protein [Kitasatospora viridis]|uniref:Lysophospholipase L1-like esterase n=1 Tax=Kitasatospora viridis TaxID=281105 RepID=A0A561UN51_9ACTN|nr:GDSL-type esterase/lipase family protein [Kitasatospora viridis]TWG00782.1 lysophospholipase L1-like esterase [Kitasatospora viridis]